ncbi:MAG TPA: DUF115 domain-containing protein [Leptospiraceae bacterium]|nr:DUF115 domain-containing protein [Leptospiraceae bacterium]HMW07749.1 DUF115 domain-containing protein [Leptospiraceae bacterium]HMX31981.1 DUF115 domain-containing protein [Leptospiraceae bacterium]HMY33415.1 DUF115 domain-containing protein [Leptospiraceae bacterium]HMZ64777.1 DUF115 domain-containing protein [Leptospiraceae bacterium]
MYSEEYSSFRDKITAKLGVNASTISYFARTWLRNYFINLQLCSDRDNTGLIFKDSLPIQNKPVLYIGAAPNLEDQLEWIKKNQDDFFLLAADTACYLLLQNGIRPDYILSIDSGRGTIYHFRNIPEDIPIISWLGGNRYIFSLKNPILLCLTSYPLDQVLHSVVFTSSNEIIQNPSLNVAGLAKALAEKFLAKSLSLSGISFKKENGKTHSRGTGYESFHVPKVNRYYPMESYIPHSYQKDISSKNQKALYHLTDTTKVPILKLDTHLPYLKDSSIYKTKPLSLKINQKQINQFLHLLKNPNIQKEILNELGVEKSVLLRFIF